MRRLTVAAVLLAALGLSGPIRAASADPAADSWPMYAHDVAGSRVNAAERTLSPSSLRAGLAVLWRSAVPGGPVYGTPAVSGGRVYAANVAGNVFALDASDGRLLWLAHVGPVATFPVVVTASVLLTDTEVIVGDQSGTVWALDQATGLIRWVQRPNNHGFPAIWGSPSLVAAHVAGRPRQLVLVPVASNEETFTTTEQQPCCLSRGSLAALDPATGAVLWQTFMITEPEAARGAAGASIWSSPSFDEGSNLVYVSTGNNYGNRPGTPTTDTSDAIVAIDASDGHIVWKNQRTPDDTYALSYRLSSSHPDADFGDSPKLLSDTSGRKLVAAGQKSGFMHVLDATTGRALAQRQFLPGGGLGGFFADSAQEHGVVFGNGNDWPGYGGGELGGLAGMIAGQIKPSSPPNAGEVVAVRADRPDHALDEVWRFATPGSPMLGAVAVANGVVYVHSSKEGNVYALDVSTGHVLAKTAVGPAVNGAAVAGGRVVMGFGDTFGMAASDPTTGGVVALGNGSARAAGASASGAAAARSSAGAGSTASTSSAIAPGATALATTGRNDYFLWLLTTIAAGLAIRRIRTPRSLCTPP
jgi:outer membrane protein assembly factor BamB